MTTPESEKGNQGKADLRWLPSGMILLAGIFISLYISYQTAQHNKQRVQSLLAGRAIEISEEVLHQVHLYQYGLRGLRGAYVTVGGAQRFNYQLLQSYTRSRDYKTEFPGARGFGFIQYVPKPQLAEFLVAAAADRPDGQFQLRQLQPHQADLFVIRYMEPEVNNQQAIGLDIGSEANRRRAAELSAEKNQLIITAPITLVQAENKVAQGFLILLPVYKNGQIPTTPELRLQQLEGWVYAPLLIDEVLATLEDKAADTLLSLLDTAQPAQMPFYQRGNSADNAAGFAPVSHSFDVAGRQWQLSLTPSNAYIASLALPSAQREFLGWFIVSCFLALLTYTAQLMIARRVAALRYQADLAIAEERSLKEANLRLEEKVLSRTAQIAKLGALNRSILASSPYAIIATDPQGLITVFNPSAELLLGHTAAEMIGLQTPAVFHSPQEVQQRALQLSEELGELIVAGFEVFVCKARRGQIDQNVWTYLRKDGSKVRVKLSVTALHDDAGKLVGFLGIAQDLELQLQREQELEDAKENALQASKAKSEFLANVSHEIRTPMHGVLGLLRIVLNGELPHKQRDYLQKAHQSALSLLALLNDILDFSKIEAGKLDIEIKPFSMAELLDDLGALLGPQAEQKSIELIFDVASDLPNFLATDGNRLRQILVNLVGNAIKFTEQGNVVLSVNSLKDCEGVAQLQVSVRDDGIGMTAAQLQGLFQEFQQADSSISRRFGGTGLGLAIVRRLVQLLGGAIQVSSEYGVGSQFNFWIPVQLPAQQELRRPDFNGIAVLVVEDNPTSALVLKEMLLYLGCEVLVAETAGQAMTLLVKRQREQRPVRIAMIDWVLPDEDGLLLLEDIKQQGVLTDKPQTILMTSYRNKLVESQLSHQDEFKINVLLKPIGQDKLSHMLMQILQMGLDGAELAAPSPQLGQRTQALAGMRILLVEDNPTNRVVATELLSQAGALITEAVDGYEAMSILQQQSFDLVLMDMQMPGMDGIETTRRIRTELNCTDMPIIAMTANATKDDKDACKAAGMNEHIAKPFEIEKVLVLLQAYAKQKPQPANPPLAVAAGLPAALRAFGQQHQIDVDAAFARLGSQSLYHKVLQQFLLDVQAAQTDLQTGSITPAKAKLIYHSLKSGAGNCGLTALATILQQAETATHQFTDEVVQADPAVLQQFNEIQPVLMAFLSLFSPSDKVQPAPPELALAEVQHLLQDFQTSLHNSDMQALEQFQVLKPYLQQQHPEIAKALDIEVSKLDFAKCIALLTSIKLPETQL